MVPKLMWYKSLQVFFHSINISLFLAKIYFTHLDKCCITRLLILASLELLSSYRCFTIFLRSHLDQVFYKNSEGTMGFKKKTNHKLIVISNCAIRSHGLLIRSHGVVIHSLELDNSFSRIAIRSLELDNPFSRIAIRSLEVQVVP